METDLELLTRRRCHLCDEALTALREAGVDPTLVDIDLDSGLLGEFDHRVPVLRRRLDGTVLAEGVIDAATVRRLADGRWSRRRS